MQNSSIRWSWGGSGRKREIRSDTLRMSNNANVAFGPSRGLDPAMFALPAAEQTGLTASGLEGLLIISNSNEIIGVGKVITFINSSTALQQNMR